MSKAILFLSVFASLALLTVLFVTPSLLSVVLNISLVFLVLCPGLVLPALMKAASTLRRSLRSRRRAEA